MSAPSNNNNLQFWDVGGVFEYAKNSSTNDETKLRFWEEGGTLEGMYAAPASGNFMPFFWGA